MERFLSNHAVMKITCMFCRYSHEYIATEEQLEAYVERATALEQIFPDMPEEALAVLDNGLYCKNCNKKSFEERARVLNEWKKTSV